MRIENFLNQTLSTSNLHRKPKVANSNQTSATTPRQDYVTISSAARDAQSKSVEHSDKHVKTDADNPMIYLDSSALYTAGMRVPGGGWLNASVYKSEAFSEVSPVMLVMGTNVDGTPFEVEININDVNPRNASLVELYALDGYNAAMGKESQISRAANHAALRESLESGDNSLGNLDAFTKFDFIPGLRGMMETQFFHKNMEGYTMYKNVIGSLMKILNATVNSSPETQTAQRASEGNHQDTQNEAEIIFAGEKVLFPKIHYDATKFMKVNPDASERELWNYIDEKYNFHRSPGMLTLEEAQAKLQPYLSTDARTLTGWDPNVKITNINFKEWERAFHK